MASKINLFLELAKPDKDGVSRWVLTLLFPSEHCHQHFSLVSQSETFNPHRLAISFGKLCFAHSVNIHSEVRLYQGTHPHQFRPVVVTDGECLYEFFSSAVTPLLSSPI